MTMASADFHIVEIVERLAHAHHHDIGDLAARRRAGPVAQGVLGDQQLAQYFAGVRLRTSFWVPVWQKRQVRVQPTWDETHSVPRSASGI